MKLIEICCMFCDQNIIALDPGFNLPLRGQMMTPSGITRNDGQWQYPMGPITTDFVCPMCGGFPWGYHDGNITSRVKALAASLPAGIEMRPTETRGVVIVDLMDVMLARGVNDLLGEPIMEDTSNALDTKAVQEETQQKVRRQTIKKGREDSFSDSGRRRRGPGRKSNPDS
jgi:hypothetical protein